MSVNTNTNVVDPLRTGTAKKRINPIIAAAAVIEDDSSITRYVMCYKDLTHLLLR